MSIISNVREIQHVSSLLRSGVVGFLACFLKLLAYSQSLPPERIHYNAL